MTSGPEYVTLEQLQSLMDAHKEQHYIHETAHAREHSTSDAAVEKAAKSVNDLFAAQDRNVHNRFESHKDQHEQHEVAHLREHTVADEAIQKVERTTAEHFIAADKSSAALFLAHKESHAQHDVAHEREHTSTDLAITKAENATNTALTTASAVTEQKFKAQNEWRGALVDRERNTPTRTELQNLIDPVEKQLTELKNADIARSAREAERERAAARNLAIVGLLASLGGFILSLLVRLLGIG